jgi:hypothetical protein
VSPGRVAPLLALALAGALAAGADAQRLVPTTDPKHPRLKFTDSLVSANDRCLVSQTKLNPAVRPVYVNGVPMGFC